MKWTFSVLDWQTVCQLGKAPHEEDSLEAISQQAVRTSGKIDSIRCQPEKQYGETNAVIKFDEFNQSISKQYGEIRNSTPLLKPSIFNLNNFVAVGPNGLLLDLENHICIVGESFGWHPEYAKWWSGNEMNATWSSDLSEFSVDWDFNSNRTDLEKCVFISQPGQDIYGHWILDIIPRLFLLKQAGFESERIVIGQIPQWAHYFLAMVGIEQRRLSILTEPNTTILRRVYVPSFLKVGFTLDRDFCANSWMSFVEQMQNSIKQDRTQGPHKIFVSRSQWNANRIIKNSLEVEQAAIARGYLVVYPEKLSIEEQYKTFRNASIIFGQDGSGLHNIIFCAKERLKLGVIGTKDRVNMWHLSICDALNHKIAYMTAKETISGVETVDLDQLNWFLDSLEST